MPWTESVASALGAPEAGLRLVLGQVASYPIFLVYRSHLRRADPWVHHVYFAVTGLCLAWYSVSELAVMHSTLCILATYFALALAGPRKETVTGLFLFNLGYLFVGYVFDSSREYDITWTMPQCVLCLRLIGLAFDLWDGTLPKEQWSKDQHNNALTEPPTILECFGHCFFSGGYFVGPQFSMKKYKTMIERNRTESDDAPSPVSYGFYRFGLGWVYMLTHLLGSAYFPEHWVMTDEFANLSFVPRSFFFYVWVKVILAKYIAAWLLAEGACVVAGLGYNGVDKDKQVRWDGAANVNLFKFETCQKYQMLIESFNVNTNGWVLSYVYKRLRFLNNKNLSQLGTLVFLAVWHGYHSGYYITFFNEFVVMLIEREFLTACSRVPAIQRLTSKPGGALLCGFLGHVYYALLLPHCFLAFAMLKRDKYMPVFQATRYFLPLYFVVGLIAVEVLKMATAGLKKQQRGEKAAVTGKPGDGMVSAEAVPTNQESDKKTD